MTRPERWLKFFLRFGAVVLMFAALAIFLPASWMRAANDALGLEPLADTPLVSYLTRSLAALYAYHGVMVWVVANDLKGYRAIIRTIGWGDIVFGVAVLKIDLYSGLPWYWTAGEGPSLVCFGVLILWLLRRCEMMWKEAETTESRAVS
jgi:hypothetical protein